MRYLLNIGNTHAQLGAWDGGRVALLQAWDSPSLAPGDLAARLRRLGIPPGAPLAVACVVPRLRRELEDSPGLDASFVDDRSYPDVDFSRYDVRTLGADRIANAGAARALYRDRPVMVVDCGTAITTEVVSAAGEFLGGAILPGRRMLRRALHAFTAQLPEVPMRPGLPAAIGSTTAHAILAGVDLGALGSVRELVRAVRRQDGLRDCQAVAVGGDAAFFVENLVGLERGRENWTLYGLAMAGPQE